MIIGIDACNIRRGGGLTHLIQLLNESNPHKHGFFKIVVWSNKNTLSLLPDFDWIEKKNHFYLEKNFIFSFYFQLWLFSNELINNSCDVVLVPGGTFLSKFRPFVTISQNMLPFELNEAFRYKSVLKKIKFILLRITQSYTFRNANGLIFLTQYAKSIISSKVNITKYNEIIPHGINYKFTLTPRKQKPFSDFNFQNPFKLLYVSILSPYKHQSNLVKVVCELYNTGIPIQLILIGPSEEESLVEFKKTEKKYDCSKFCINYMGGIPYESLFNEYKSADGFVFASSCENLPIILIEAMSSGLPILCSKFGPMKEVLGENGEMYFNPLDLNNTKSQLEEFLLNQNLREKISNESFSRSLIFTWSEMANKTFSFLIKTNLKYHDRKR
jgi:glycosyltransferase involved in cell wall biosynthesis